MNRILLIAMMLLLIWMNLELALAISRLPERKLLFAVGAATQFLYAASLLLTRASATNLEYAHALDVGTAGFTVSGAVFVAYALRGGPAAPVSPKHDG